MVPSGSADAVASKLADRSLALWLKAAVGAWLARGAMVTACLVVAVAPRSSVTVTVMV